MMRWDQYFYESAILKIAAGDRLTLQHLNYDEFNQEAMKYAVSVPAEELVKKAIDVRMNIIGAIRDMPENKKSRNVYRCRWQGVFHSLVPEGKLNLPGSPE